MIAPIVLLLTLALAFDIRAEVTTHWWGFVSFRQRQETTKEFINIGISGQPGELLQTTDNSSTRLGYQLGLRADMRENLTAGVTLRSGLSGLAQVMHQDIHNKDGLVPSIQEAYLDWRPPFARLELGKIPQLGDALWDVYAATMQTDKDRANDPRDGVFNDRMAALNGARLTKQVGPLTLRGVYHTDYVAGYYRELENSTKEFERAPDRYVYLVGLTGDFPLAGEGSKGSAQSLLLSRLKLDFDYGFPYRAARAGDNPDSTYADEKLWGTTIRTTGDAGFLQFGTAYNWRDSLFTISFVDAIAQADIGRLAALHGASDFGEFTLTWRFQQSTEELQFEPYKGAKAIRKATFLYLDKSLWGLTIQPRAIWFTSEIEDFKEKTRLRYEVTATVRF